MPETDIGPVAPVWIKIWTAWAVALAVILIFFLIWEAWALIRPGRGDTLSETVWYLRDQGRWLYWLILDVVSITLITMAWLIFHFRWQGGRFSL